MNSLRAQLNSEHLSSDARDFADVLSCFVKGDAIGGVEAGVMNRRIRTATGAQIRATDVEHAARRCPGGQPRAAVPTCADTGLGLNRYMP